MGKAYRALTRLALGDQSDKARDDRGASITEYVLTLAIAIGAATAVGAIIVPLLVDAAQSIDLGIDL